MIDHTQVLSVVRTELQRLDQPTQAKFRWENRIVEPGDPTAMYVEERLIPFSELPIGSEYDRLIAEVRYSVVVPRGAGTEDARKLAGQIKALFKAGQALVGQIVVNVTSSETLSGRLKDQARYAIPVAVTIRVDANRYEGV